MCIIFSRIHVLNRIRIMTTCKDWYNDIRECCSRQNVIAFHTKRDSVLGKDFRQCHRKIHHILKNEIIRSSELIRNLMSDPAAIKSFHKLFPNLTVIKAADVSRDFLAPYAHKLQCLNLMSIKWTRTAPQVFDNVTCLNVCETANIRLSAKTFPRLKSLIAVTWGRNTRNPGIESLLRGLPAALIRLECCARSMDRIGTADFAIHLTHVRIQLLEKWVLTKDLILPSLKSLVLINDPDHNHSELLQALVLHLKVPKLQAFGLFLFETRSVLIRVLFLLSH